MPLSFFCVAKLLHGVLLSVVCFPRETSLKKISFLFAEDYQSDHIFRKATEYLTICSHFKWDYLPHAFFVSLSLVYRKATGFWMSILYPGHLLFWFITYRSFLVKYIGYFGIKCYINLFLIYLFLIYISVLFYPIYLSCVFLR